MAEGSSSICPWYHRSGVVEGPCLARAVAISVMVLGTEGKRVLAVLVRSAGAFAIDLEIEGRLTLFG